MPMFSVFAKVTGTKHLGNYRARSSKEAIEKAGKDAYVILCSQCAEECDDAECTDLTAEKVEATENDMVKAKE